ADELVDDHLGTVHEIAELRFPQDETFGVIAGEAIFKAEAGRFGERGIVNFAKGLRRGKMRKREILLFILRINQNGVALVEGAALRILAGEADGIAFEDERAVGKKLREPVIHRAFAVAHFRALIEKLHDFGMDVKAFGSTHKPVSNSRDALGG